ncbi:ABC transporter permease [Prauserella oleivorans]
MKELAAMIGVDVSFEGPVDVFSWPGILVLFTISLVPHVYLVVSAALRNLEPSLEEASRVNGVGAFGTLLKVTLPAICPALINAALLALAAGFALFSIPFLVGSSAGIDNLIVRVVRLTTYEFPARVDQASVLGLLVVLVIGSSLLLQRRVTKLARHARLEGKTSSPSRVDLGWFTWVARLLMLAYVAFAAVLPVLALVYVSLQSFWSGELTFAGLTFDHYRDLLSNGSVTVQALRNSVLLGALTACVAMAVVAIIAYFMERRPKSWLGRGADAVAKLPGALSHVVVALALIVAVSGPPFNLQGTLVILFVGYLVMYLPQASVNANSALSQLGPTLSEASLISGASEGRTFVRVVVPLMLPGLLAGWVMVFVLVAGDLTASAMLAGPSSQVAGSVMLDLATSGTYGLVAALGVMITAVCSVIGGAVLLLARRTGRSRGGRATRRRTRRLSSTSASGNGVQ